ncbi:hypothetical protein JYU07_00705 [Roseiflexus sp. AH-315-K22]|nr:hypothetical protein [Roseiflexus sp. AH-315-K22]
MNWIIIAIMGWVALGLDTGLVGALELGHSGISPSFVVVLAVFVGLAAPPVQAVWTCLLLGLAVDLLSPLSLTAPQGASATVVGPYALGYVLMAQFLLAMRSMLMRHNPLTMAVMAFVGFLIVHVFVSAAYTLRGFYDPIAWDMSAELVRRLGVAAYTGVVAFPLALVLVPMAPALGMQIGHPKNAR